MATIIIDNVQYEVKDGQNLLTACLSLGLNVPYFCWHPALHSVGACRQCAVKNFRNEKDTRGHIVMSCMTPVQDGMRISLNDPEVREFRGAVIEWLMINHPHDCPVCDEGGECHLQDMTVMTGHTYRRTRSKKRTLRNQDLGPFIHHEMNRCIQCYRCVRFYRDYACGRDLDVFGIHDRLYFGRFENGTLESEFSGNLVEVCPTGVFTDRTFRRHYTRKWDLQTAPSVCIHCGVGCNTIPGERYGSLRRIRNRYHGEVNRYFLCDRGRFGYEFVNGPTRARKPMIRRGNGIGSELEAVSVDEAILEIKRVVAESSGIIGIGSPRASLESNFALASLVGRENFFSGLSDADQDLVSCMAEILRHGPAHSPSLREMESSDVVLVLGEDTGNTAPMTALAIIQALQVKPYEAAADLKVPRWDAGAVQQVVQGRKGPLFVATPYDTRLDGVSKLALRLAPNDIARLGFAVAANLDSITAKIPDLPDRVHEAVTRITGELKESIRPLIVSGTGCGTRSVMEAAANIAWSLCRSGKKAALSLSSPECNSVGAALLGGRGLQSALAEVKSGRVDTVIVLENNLYRRAEPQFIEELVDRAKNLVVLDHSLNDFASRASMILPVGTFAESEGTLVNNEGRAQRFFRVMCPVTEIRESWQWIQEIAAASKSEGPVRWHTFDEVTSAMAAAIPVFEKVRSITPPADFRISGQKIARQSFRYSGRTALSANINIHEPAPPTDKESPLTFSMEGYQQQPASALIPRFWAPGWNSVQAVNKFQSEIGGPLQGGDPGRRLLEASETSDPDYFSQIPTAFEPREKEWLFVAMYHVFGSEEFSSLSPGILERSPGPYVGLNETDKERLFLSEGELVHVAIGNRFFRLVTRVIPGLPRGLAGLPVGVSGLEGVALPAWGSISTRPNHERDQR